MHTEKRRELLNSHLENVSTWLEEEGIDGNSNLGKELLKQTRTLIEQIYEIEGLKSELSELKNND